MKSHHALLFKNNTRSLIIIVIALTFGLFLWLYSDEPPYGTVNNELSNGYWGVIVNIAHKWRAMEFNFWDREVFGGMSLYTSGQYPILNPTNVLAFFLNDNQFYLAKLIEPYFFGVLFMLILLYKHYKISLPISIFGSFTYMGLLFSRQTLMLQSPYFLWGIALFPLMVYVMERYIEKDIYLSAAFVGVVIAWMFAGSGVIHLPQFLIWWVLFYFIRICADLSTKLWLRNIKKWLICACLMAIMGLGILAVQFIPTYEFVMNEAVSRAGHYPINNFPVWESANPFSLGEILKRGFLMPGGVSGYGFGVLVLGVILLTILWPKKTKTAVTSFYNLPFIWLSTVIFFCIPSFIEVISAYVPFVRKPLSVFSTFTFMYGLHTLDFCFAVTLCLFLDQRKITLAGAQNSRWKILISTFFVLAASGLVFLPVLLKISGAEGSLLLSYAPFLTRFIPTNLTAAVIVFILSMIGFIFLLSHPQNIIYRVISGLALISLGFMMSITSYNWNDKGRRNHFENYCWDCPEHLYYTNATKKYFFPIDSRPFLGYNYPLLYDVYSTSLYLNPPPKRFASFLNNYAVSNTSLTPPNYFPIDFTALYKGKVLNWKNFQLKVNGTVFDIYENTTQARKVFFANHLVILPSVDELRAKAFHEPHADKFYIAESDVKYLKNQSMKSANSLKGEPQYTDFVEVRQDFLKFKSIAPSETFAMVPEMFQAGWKVKIDDKLTQTFPVDFLFVGFRLPAGEHWVEIKFLPPKIFLGLSISLLSILTLIALAYVKNSRSKDVMMSAPFKGKQISNCRE